MQPVASAVTAKPSPVKTVDLPTLAVAAETEVEVTAEAATDDVLVGMK
jgi:hypothetical protein